MAVPATSEELKGAMERLLEQAADSMRSFGMNVTTDPKEPGVWRTFTGHFGEGVFMATGQRGVMIGRLNGIGGLDGRDVEELQLSLDRSTGDLYQALEKGEVRDGLTAVADALERAAVRPKR